MTDSDGQARRFRPFQLNIEPADKIDELKLEVTAPTIAAIPRRPIVGGTARANSSGIASAGVACSRAMMSFDQGYANAERPMRSGGTTNSIVNTPARIDWRLAS